MKTLKALFRYGEKRLKSQGALEYLLLLGGVLIVVVIVIYLLSGLATTGNQTVGNASSSLNKTLSNLTNMLP